MIFPQQISTAHGKFQLSSLSFLNFILFSKSIIMKNQNLQPLLALIALSTVHSCAQIFSHNAILFIDTSDNVWYKQVHWPYLSIIASNVTNTKSVKTNIYPVHGPNIIQILNIPFFSKRQFDPLFNVRCCEGNLRLSSEAAIMVSMKGQQVVWNVEGQLFVLSVVIELGSLGKHASCLLHWTNYFCVVQLCKLEIPNRENDSVSYSW